MRRSENLVEIQNRLWDIKTANGYPFDVVLVERDPTDPPEEDVCPCIYIFGLDEYTESDDSRGASSMPIYIKKQLVAIECWIVARTRASMTVDLDNFLACVRHRMFYDGRTLGGTNLNVEETEVSKVLRPRSGFPIAGYGLVYELTFVEDFSAITF